MSDLHDSAPPRDALSAFEVAIQLDRLTREVKAMRVALDVARTNDERFAQVEREFKALQATLGAMKKYIGGAVAAALAALATVVIQRMTRVPDSPPPITSSGASTALDRQYNTPPHLDGGAR